MTTRYTIAPDVTFQLRDKGALASNHRARSHVWLNFNLFRALGGEVLARTDLLQASDWTRFGNVDGLLADPTCLEEKEGKELVSFQDLEEAYSFLTKRFILIENPKEYRDYFFKKNSLVDQKHFGTFHQRLGAELYLRRKTDPALWWYQQKFDPKTGQVKDNLYKFIQGHFLENYFKELDVQGKTVLDFGCGSGMAAKLFADRGARVIGVDPDPNLLEKAKKKIGSPFHPVLFQMRERDPLRLLPEEEVDFVWLADVFMFYFYSQDGREPILPPGQLLSRLIANLKPKGFCVIMQPHGVFWLAPWLGEPEKPYTILTEYREKLYSVTPGLEELSQEISKAGLVIRNIYEPKPSLESQSFDRKAFSFASHFPQWWVFECLKLS